MLCFCLALAAILTGPYLQNAGTHGVSVCLETSAEEKGLKLRWGRTPEELEKAPRRVPFTFARAPFSGTWLAVARVDGQPEGTRVCYEVGGRRVVLEEGHGTDVVLIEVPILLHHLLEENLARRDPVDLQLATEPLLKAVNRLKRHVGLARADGRLQHDRLDAAVGKCSNALADRLLLILAFLVVLHQAALEN